MRSDENTDELLRLTLRRHPAPVPAATFTDDIVRRATSYESVRRQRTRFSHRALLIAYWLAVAVGSWWVVRSLPLPAWTPESLSPALAWLIPCAGALLVWRRPILRWLAAVWRRLLSTPSVSMHPYSTRSTP
jgi:hypothetical protein